MASRSRAGCARELEDELRAKGFDDERVLAALAAVPRERFVPKEHAEAAWRDRALPLPWGQSISQPYVVATMCSAAELSAGSKVLEVGTGWGYQAAVLGRLAREVVTLERVPELAAEARRRLAELGVENVRVLERDGWLGCPESAPFDAIVVAAAAERVPEELLRELAEGGRLVLPLGVEDQRLIVLRNPPTGLARRDLYPVRFVPLVREGRSAP
ncbi:MAG: protein-L-isoaspartate(D-aspartate) O-methyltransferase [Planctomycetes bacterium]|nr:protein-L-isoaspartate(D-aspartate) O-methyltransferase [Planctomycetota bacterium]